MYRPQVNEYAQSPFVSRYIDQVGEGNVIELLAAQLSEVQQLYGSLKEEQGLHRYAEGKWTLKELLGHTIDTERIQSYRALCIARGEKQALPGFDENMYVELANFNVQTFEELLTQHRLVRENTLALIRTFSEEMLLRKGNANGKDISVRALIYVIAGHERHHLGILREKYFPGLNLLS